MSQDYHMIEKSSTKAQFLWEEGDKSVPLATPALTWFFNDTCKVSKLLDRSYKHFKWSI